MDRFNAEGYPDPTAANALAAVAQEEKARAWKPCVFICSPFAGDIETNTMRAIRYTRFAVASGAIPFAPHLLYPQVLELWVFGRHISAGMSREIAKAKKRGIPIRRFNDKCEEEFE